MPDSSGEWKQSQDSKSERAVLTCSLNCLAKLSSTTYTWKEDLETKSCTVFILLLWMLPISFMPQFCCLWLNYSVNPIHSGTYVIFAFYSTQSPEKGLHECILGCEKRKIHIYVLVIQNSSYCCRYLSRTLSFDVYFVYFVLFCLFLHSLIYTF